MPVINAAFDMGNIDLKFGAKIKKYYVRTKKTDPTMVESVI